MVGDCFLVRHVSSPARGAGVPKGIRTSSGGGRHLYNAAVDQLVATLQAALSRAHERIRELEATSAAMAERMADANERADLAEMQVYALAVARERAGAAQSARTCRDSRLVAETCSGRSTRALAAMAVARSRVSALPLVAGTLIYHGEAG
jgi:hypothetical protein